jgi:fructoselysine-6-P-deglycase FrlB-like protein
MREAAGAWTEAYPAMEYRHGPISITGPGRVVWSFGPLPEGLAENIAEVGGHLEIRSGTDPLADLIRAQRLAVTIARAKGYDPDRPRNLTRSVVLR